MYPAHTDKLLSPAPILSLARLAAGTLFALLLLGPPALWAQLPEAQWDEPAETATSVDQGHLSLLWSVKGETSESYRFQLQQSFDGSFADQRVAYEGRDRGTFASGLPPEGAQFRVRAALEEGGEWGPWSETLEVSVDYPSERRVALFGILGGVMFVVLVITISRGALLHRSATQG